MSDVKQLLRKAVLNKKTVRVTLQDGEKIRGILERNQNIRFQSSDSLVRVKHVPEGQKSTSGTKQVAVSDVEDVEFVD